jgi:uncharacterized protein (TIGR04255 family)
MMARAREHLQNAPIVEAVIDFRVSRQEQVSAGTFADIGSSIGKRYTQSGPIQSLQTRFGIDNGKLLEPWQMQTDIGWRYQTVKEIAQFRMDGFTFSRIAPYTTWTEVSNEAFRLWKVYVDAAKPREVSRVAVRYINRMQLTAGKDLRDYLEAPPQLPEPIPQTIREFLARVYVHDDKRIASAVIVTALEPTMDPDAISLLLDIDAFREVKEAPDDPVILSVFEQLRQLKNAIFFASITEEIVEKYA